MTDPNDSPLDRLSVAPADEAQGDAPDGKTESGPSKGDAGQDRSIERRLEKHPESREARLDRGLDESMDASDPPAATQPVHSNEPPASSGYDPEAEKQRSGN